MSLFAWHTGCEDTYLASTMLRLVRRATGLPELEVPAPLLQSDSVVLPLTVGRAPQNDLRLHSEASPLVASRFHAEITQAEGSYILTDTRSTNGTYVNGAIIQPYSGHALQQGDILSFGGPQLMTRTSEPEENPFVYVCHIVHDPPSTAHPPRDAAPPSTGAAGGRAHPGGHQEGAPPPPSRRRAREESGEEEDAIDVGVPPAQRVRRMPAPSQLVLHRVLAMLARGAALPGVAGPPASEPPPEPEGPPSAEALKAGQEAYRARAQRAEPLPQQCLQPLLLERLKAQRSCSICFLVRAAPHSVSCGHLFCGQCITTWLRKSPHCPLCRAPGGAAHPVLALEAQVRDMLQPGLGEEEGADLRRRLLDWEVLQAGRAAAAAALGAGCQAQDREATSARVPAITYHALRSGVGRIVVRMPALPALLERQVAPLDLTGPPSAQQLLMPALLERQVAPLSFAGPPAQQRAGALASV